MSEKGLRKDGLPWPRLLASGAVGLLTALGGILLLALLGADALIGTGREALAARGALLLGTALGAFLACRKAGEGRVVAAAVAGGVSLVFVLLLSLLGPEARLFSFATLKSILCVIAGSLVGCALSARRRKRRRRRN